MIIRGWWWYMVPPYMVDPMETHGETDIKRVCQVVYSVQLTGLMVRDRLLKGLFRLTPKKFQLCITDPCDENPLVIANPRTTCGNHTHVSVVGLLFIIHKNKQCMKETSRITIHSFYTQHIPLHVPTHSSWLIVDSHSKYVHYWNSRDSFG